MAQKLMFVLFTMVALVGLLFPACGGDGSSSAAGGASPKWYPGTCVRTDEGAVCDFPSCTERHTYTYDGEGRIVAYTFDDHGADGTADSKITFTYNPDGTMTEHRDYNADGTVDQTETVDPQNEAICDANPGQRFFDDTDGDGVNDRVAVCDTNGRVVREERKGKVLDTAITTYTYDSKGRLLRKEHVDGVESSVTTYTYEPDGTGWSESDSGPDGSINHRTTCTCGECRAYDH